jgi:hypothetical protein
MMMVKSRNSNNFLILGLASSIFIGSNFLQINLKKPEIKISKQQSALNINQNFLKFFSLGNKRLISDILWIQTLLESDNEHYSLRDKNSWMYHRFHSISELDPLFYENYLWGGQFLSIVKDDVEGASDIYERGLKHYPNDYKLNFNSGFNYYFEMGDLPKGLAALRKIKDHPDLPAPVKNVINKLEFETSGNYELALNFLILNYNQTNDKVIRKKILSEIYSLKAEKDLKCLNEKQIKCDRKDAEGNFYILKNGTFKALRDFKNYRVKRKK